MNIFSKFGLLRGTVSLLVIWLATGIASAAPKDHYVVTNDDSLPPTISTVSFYAIASNGRLTLKGAVPSGGLGISGGFFGAVRLRVLDGGKSQCVYVSDAASRNIVGINVHTMTVGGAAVGSEQDTGYVNGIGLAMTPEYLYGGFTDLNIIGTFQVMPGCKLSFHGDVRVDGLQGGTILGMAIHGDVLVATYTDGSIESFNISGGRPVSNGDLQESTGSRGGNTYPSGIAITQDGHYAIFGDVATSTIIEVADISSGKLAPTIVYHLGNAISASNILLSPDESLLYISNTQGDRVSGAFFDKNTGELTRGCASGRLRGYSTDWSYLGSLALAQTTGTGSTVYVAEFGAPSSIGAVRVTSNGRSCKMKEISTSPFADPNSTGLLSIGVFPAAVID
jgi:hypothetical protein